MIQDALREGREGGVEEGVEIGLEKGRQEGREESRRDLLAAASAKFGLLPDAVAELVLDTSRESASVALAVVLATSVEELHASLRDGDRS